MSRFHRLVLCRAFGLGVIVCAALGLAASAAVALAALSAAAERGWSPMLALAGARDADRAMLTLRAVAERWSIAIENTEMDAATRELLSQATESLKDFNLERMYKLLPDQDGSARRLGVSAGFEGRRYAIVRRKDLDFEVRPGGSRQQMGDASVVLRATPVQGEGGDSNFLLEARAGIVVGPIAWPMVVDGAQQFLQVLGSGAEADARPRDQFRQKVRGQAPSLGAEDIDPLATLWEAFPRMGDMLSTLGAVEDLVDADPLGPTGGRRVHAVLHLDPKQMKAHYPELADYLADLDNLMEVDLRWVDAQNRSFARLHLDSQRLRAQLELFERDGVLLPSRAGKPALDQPMEVGPGKLRYRVLASAHLHALGLRVAVRDMQLDFLHDHGPQGMELRGQMTHLPNVQVKGAALGFVPTGVIDLFIPGNIQSLVDKALHVACHGNFGKGLELRARYFGGASGAGSLDGGLTIEAVDDFLVKLGVSHFNHYVLPNEDQRADLRRVFADVQRAFSQDLERYAQARAAQPPRAPEGPGGE